MSFEDLAKKISPKLKRITYRLNHYNRFFNHDDLFQEAMLCLWTDFNNNRLTGKTESYILQGCYFHLKNYIRTKQDKAQISSLEALINDEAGSCLEEVLPSSDIRRYFDYLHSKIFVEKMQNNGLSKKEKTVLSLYLEGLTSREIGKRIGLSHVGVIKIKNKIKDKYLKFFNN